MSRGLSDPNKGYNEFALYGDDQYYSLPDLNQDFYYLYTGVSWYNPNLDRPFSEPGRGFGIFVQNLDDWNLDGWWCEVDTISAPFSQYGWICQSTQILTVDFDPAMDYMPVERIDNGWWECGCENKNTYT